MSEEQSSSSKAREDIAASVFDQATRRLINAANSLTVQTEDVARQLKDRPTHREAERARHTTIVHSLLAVFWIILLAVQVTDMHTEKCGPGARAEAVLNEFITNPHATSDGLRAIGNRRLPVMCDVSFPVHAHPETQHWPTGWNVVGLASYTLLFIVSVWAMRREWYFHRTKNLEHEDGGVQQGDDPQAVLGDES